jgi:pyrroloquinoline-quinone synthase
VELFERLDRVCERWNLLRHPFYRRWECGELTRDELSWYAGEYRHAVVALSELARAGGDEHAAEETAHIDLWDDFAAAVDAELAREPSPETAVCVDAWQAPADELEGLAALYAIESGQPDVARTKLEGLVAHYGFVDEGPATAYFALHAERDVEHAAHSRTLLEEHARPEDADRLVAAAETALRGSWTLLDGVERQKQT